jgi:hypothetical protein
MIRISWLWGGGALVSVAVLTLLASEYRWGEGASGAVPVGEDILAAARGLMPNYTSLSANGACCANSLNGGAVCVCSVLNVGANCNQCKGISAPSGLYSNTLPDSGIEPTGTNADCDSLDLYTGTCNAAGNCITVNANTGCPGVYPTYINQGVGLNEGYSSGVQHRLAMATVNRR